MLPAGFPQFGPPERVRKKVPARCKHVSLDSKEFQ